MAARKRRLFYRKDCMTPDPAFVRELEAYDPKLRARWAQHSEKWFIERKLEQRHPALQSEAPAPTTAKPLQRDLYEAWQQGYVHVLTVPREMMHWNLVVEHLAKYDSWRQGGMQGINRQLDAEAEQEEKSADRRIDNVVADATDDAYERLAWLSGRRVAVTDPEPVYADSGLGFKIRDRRATAA